MKGFTISILLVVPAWFGSPASAEGLRKKSRALQEHNGCITRKEMVDRIQSFADAVPGISQEYWSNGGGDEGEASVEGCRAARALANAALFGAYAYPGHVNFKPTLSTAPYTYRPTRAGALSYFIGTECVHLAGVDGEWFPPGNNGTMFYEHGFAINNKHHNQGWLFPTLWEPAEFMFHVDEEGGPYCHAPTAMGQICFQQGDGSGNTCVDKTFGFTRDEEGIVVIVNHHSSQAVAQESSNTVCMGVEPGPACNSTYHE